jgi:hypothetical protein
MVRSSSGNLQRPQLPPQGQQRFPIDFGRPIEATLMLADSRFRRVPTMAAIHITWTVWEAKQKVRAILAEMRMLGC